MTNDNREIVYFHTIEYYTAMKINDIQPHITCMNLSDMMLSDKSRFQQTWLA